MTRPYALTRSAAADLRGIVRYSTEQWGEAQCRRYIAQLEAAAVEVALGRGVFKQFDEAHPGLRVRREGRYYIFCLPRPRKPAVILAILHERMDMIAYLRHRLDVV